VGPTSTPETLSFDRFQVCASLAGENSLVDVLGPIGYMQPKVPYPPILHGFPGPPATLKAQSLGICVLWLEKNSGKVSYAEGR
jgi:hypothetical protein